MNLNDLNHRDDIGVLLKSLNLDGFGAEIGVLWGVNAENILQNSNLKNLFLVDLWEKQERESYIDGANGLDLEGALNNSEDRLKRFLGRYSNLKMSSDEAANLFKPETFDFIYLDANHHNPQFERDLINWFPLVKKGGIFGGHDYYNVDLDHFKCEVKETIDKFAKENNLILHITNHEDEPDSWWIQK